MAVEPKFEHRSTHNFEPCKNHFSPTKLDPIPRPFYLRPRPSCSTPPQGIDTRSLWESISKGIDTRSLWESISKVSLIAVLSTSVVFASNPALPFKGGGPYGAGVTRGQDLTGQDLIKQDFKTSILRQANFKGAKLLGASFFDADLTGDLSDSELRGADFSLANLTKANLSNANLEGVLVKENTSFKGSTITGADFYTDVPLRDDQRQYLCKVANGVNPVTGNETRETLLCR